MDKKKDYEIALINLETYYLFPNVDRSNNCFTYSPYPQAPWVDIIILESSHRFEDINEIIKREMRNNDHYDEASDKNNIEISANTNTLNSEMFLKNNYEVDFRKDKSINSLLGFHSTLYISGSYVNGSTQHTIYSFFSDVFPGYKIIENPHNLLYLPITVQTRFIASQFG